MEAKIHKVHCLSTQQNSSISKRFVAQYYVDTGIFCSNMPDEEHDKELKTTTEDDLLRLSQEELILNVSYTFVSEYVERHYRNILNT